MSEWQFIKCPICKQWEFTKHHICPPAWFVILEEDRTPEAEWAKVYAPDAQTAVSKFCEDIPDQRGGEEHTVFVKSGKSLLPGGHGDELAFRVTFELILSFNVEPIETPERGEAEGG